MKGSAVPPSVPFAVGAGAPIRLGWNVSGHLVINRSARATIWVGPDSLSGEGRGTPVYAGTSIRWTSDGDLYAVLGSDADSLAEGSAAVTLTSQVTDWQPDPVATGAAVAAELLASGVPINQSSDRLYNGTVAGNANSGWIDVRQYQGLVLTINTSATAVLYVDESFDGGATSISIGSATMVTHVSAPTAARSWVPVGGWVRLRNPTATAVTNVVLMASTRNFGNRFAGYGTQVQYNSLAVGALTLYPMLRTGGILSMSAYSTHKFRMGVWSLTLSNPVQIVDGVASVLGVGAGGYLAGPVRFNLPVSEQCCPFVVNADAGVATFLTASMVYD